MKRRNPRRLAAWLLLAFGSVAIGFGCGKAPPPLAPPDAPQVSVQPPVMRSYSPVKEFTGRLITKDPVMVIPQVSGMVMRRTFIDGEKVIGPIRLFGIAVRPGTLLFEIDKVQFEADLKKAKADIARAEGDIKNWQAQIKLADAEFRRVDEAFQKNAAPKTDLDKAAAQVDVSKASSMFPGPTAMLRSLPRPRLPRISATVPFTLPRRDLSDRPRWPSGASSMPTKPNSSKSRRSTQSMPCSTWMN